MTALRFLLLGFRSRGFHPQNRSRAPKKILHNLVEALSPKRQNVHRTLQNPKTLRVSGGPKTVFEAGHLVLQPLENKSQLLLPLPDLLNLPEDSRRHCRV